MPVRQVEAPTEALSAALRTIFGIQTAEAATLPKYWGSPVAKTVTVEAAPGETKTVELQFKNTGSASWSPQGRAYVSAYTIQPRYHASVFGSDGWIAPGHPAKIATTAVKYGQTGTVRLTLKAPAKAGAYTDSFQLAAEDTSWIWGAYATVTLKVKSGVVASPAAPTPPATTAAADVAPPPLKGAMYYRSADRIEAPGGQQMTMRFIFRNDGDIAWKKQGLHVAAFSGPAGGDTDISDPSWASPTMPVAVDRQTGPRQTIELYVTITTPSKHGDYDLSFEFVADGAAMQPAIDLPIKVISDAAASPPSVQVGPQGEPLVPETSPSGEPIIRVGLYTTDHHEEIGSTGPFEARAVDGSLLASFPAGTRAQFWYDLSSRAYRLTGNGVDLVSVSPIRFSQTGGATFFTLWSFDHRPGWNPSLDDNTFRGIVELRKNDANDYVWMIDELSIEQYLKGMGETSNASPTEFQKALAVAARSYAYWHYNHPGKHGSFTVDATYDQVYLGYNAELRLPRWADAIAATRGQVVTYGGDMVVTPYYSSSDGRTRAWTEVWGGSAKPWLVSVACPYDAAAGRPLNGHGVGMSAWDAIDRANAGSTYDVILKWYYQGTDLKTAY